MWQSLISIKNFFCRQIQKCPEKSGFSGWSFLFNTLIVDLKISLEANNLSTTLFCFRFRFILSLSGCKKCLVIDDQLKILPISSQSSQVTSVTPKSSVRENYYPNNLKRTKKKEEEDKMDICFYLHIFLCELKIEI